jgi:hypothetical protein
MIVCRVLEFRWFPYLSWPKRRPAPYKLIGQWGYWVVLFGARTE